MINEENRAILKIMAQGPVIQYFRDKMFSPKAAEAESENFAYWKENEWAMISAFINLEKHGYKIVKVKKGKSKKDAESAIVR